MTVSQLLVWTALPTGISNGKLTLSVFLAPQLSATYNAPATFAPLSDFPDFVNWPQAINETPDGPITFDVTLFDGTHTVTVAATIVTPASPAINAANAWSLLFSPTTTKVEPFTFTDYSTRTINTFPAEQIESFVSSIYGTLGTITPTNPLLISASRKDDSNSLAAGDATGQSVLTALEQLAEYSGQSGTNGGPTLLHANDIPDTSTSFPQLQAFHAPLENPTYELPELPTLDFHAGLTGLNNYPVVLRLFNLVFDLEIAAPENIDLGDILISVTPNWTSQLGRSSKNVSPWTITNYSNGEFQPLPQGPDYANRMLSLNDTTRFTVSNLDTDLAGDRLLSLGTTLSLTQGAQQASARATYGRSSLGQLALTVPALRSSGPQVIWTGYADSPYAGFAGLLDGQATLQASLTTWLTDPVTANLPVIWAEQLMRGYRVDVLTLSESSPAWRSLCGRYGQYVFGPNGDSPLSFEYFDEGMVSPSASQKADPVFTPTPADLWVHESILRWRGWGLCAQRPGTLIDRYSASTISNPKNVPAVPVVGQPSAPQLSAYFLPPAPTSTLVGSGFLFPKLRFGNQYQFRARGVDLAGNSVAVTSSDASTATPVFTHYRYEPVRPPVVAGMAPFTPGEATYYLVLLDDQVHTPGTNGRWLFPPGVSELMAEEHGMLDYATFGGAPSLNDPPASDAQTYNMLVNSDTATLATMPSVQFDYLATPIGTFDPANQGVPYFTGSPQPWTPYLPDPFSWGSAILGLPGVDGPVANEWNGTWPQADPVLIELSAGELPTTQFTAATSGVPGTYAVTLPQAGVAVMRLSSAMTASSLEEMGVWQWFGPAGGSTLLNEAELGQVWLLSPYSTLRMVHAVRLPLSAPSFGSPLSSRNPGDVSVDLSDPEFLVDEASTSHVDVLASWTDRYDNPNDPLSDPSAPLTNVAPASISTVSSSGPAFRLTIPDPNPNGPDAQPMTLQVYPESFAFGPNLGDDHGESSTHRIGDTKHHLINYTATGTSRFSELFATTVGPTEVFVNTPIMLGSLDTGLNASSVVIDGGATSFVNGVDYSINEATQMFTLLNTAGHPTGSSYNLTFTFEPTVTLTGLPVPVQILSSAPPKAPVISQVVPAWQLEEPVGSLQSGISFSRTGGFLRIYLERPWYTSGDGELLGVVTTVTTEAEAYTSTFPTSAQQGWVTMMGVDPINYVGASHTPWPVVPTQFGDLAVVPEVPYRPPYTHPPQVYLQEDTDNLYQIWPYNVEYDADTDRWYADVAPRPGITNEGTYPPPPGYFIRLALCRFQPFSTYESSPENGVMEVSPVVLATFAQPVPDRSVSVVANSADATHKSVLVSVTGPGYQGFRPPENFADNGVVQYDADNAFAPSYPSIYKGGIFETVGRQHSSTMVVEVQIQNTVLNKYGLIGDLAWETVKGPYELLPTFSGEVFVTWGSTKAELHGNGVITLPEATNSTTKMRLRISEIDYYTDSAAPTVVDTRYRRPFVTFIPVN